MYSFFKFIYLSLFITLNQDSNFVSTLKAYIIYNLLFKYTFIIRYF